MLVSNSYAEINVQYPWHPLNQISISKDNFTSLDENKDGRIDRGLTEEDLQSITENGASTTYPIVVRGGIVYGDTIIKGDFISLGRSYFESETYFDEVVISGDLLVNTLYVDESIKINAEYVDFGGAIVKNVAYPLDEHDAVPKSYVDKYVETFLTSPYFNTDVLFANYSIVDYEVCKTRVLEGNYDDLLWSFDASNGLWFVQVVGYDVNTYSSLPYGIQIESKILYYPYYADYYLRDFVYPITYTSIVLVEDGSIEVSVIGSKEGYTSVCPISIIAIKLK